MSMFEVIPIPGILNTIEASPTCHEHGHFEPLFFFEVSFDEIQLFVYPSQTHIFIFSVRDGAAHSISHIGKATQVKVLSGMHGIALIAMRIANGILTKTGHSKAFGNLDEKYLEANGFTVLGAVYLGLNDRPAQGRGFGDNIRPRGRGSPA